MYKDTELHDAEGEVTAGYLKLNGDNKVRFCANCIVKTNLKPELCNVLQIFII